MTRAMSQSMDAYRDGLHVCHALGSKFPPTFPELAKQSPERTCTHAKPMHAPGTVVEGLHYSLLARQGRGTVSITDRLAERSLMSSIQGIEVGDVDDVFVFHVLRCVGGQQAKGHGSRFKLTWSSCGSAQTLNRSKEI